MPRASDIRGADITTGITHVDMLNTASWTACSLSAQRTLKMIFNPSCYMVATGMRGRAKEVEANKFDKYKPLVIEEMFNSTITMTSRESQTIQSVALNR